MSDWPWGDRHDEAAHHQYCLDRQVCLWHYTEPGVASYTREDGKKQFACLSCDQRMRDTFVPNPHPQSGRWAWTRAELARQPALLKTKKQRRVVKAVDVEPKAAVSSKIVSQVPQLDIDWDQ